MSDGVRFDPDAIRILATILADTGLTEIEISEKDSRIRVARMPAPIAPSMAHYAMPMQQAPMPQGVMTGAMAGAAAAPPPQEIDASHPGAVTSPMVGVAYLSPEPGTPPYATLGAQVTAGQTLLLIEAMKTFNQIKAPKAGTVTRILVASGAPVEYGEVLMIVE